MTNKRKTILIVLVLALGIILPTITRNVEGIITSANIISPADGVTYGYTTTTMTVTTKISFYGEDTWYYPEMKFDSEANYVAVVSHSKYVSSSDVEYSNYLDYELVIDIDSFEIGEHILYLKIRAMVTGAFYDNLTFYRDSEAPPVNARPSVTITTPADTSSHDVNTGSISTTATISDSDGSLTSVYCKWDGVTNESWSYPAEGSFSHSITIAAGVTTNGTHTITWVATDNIGDSRESEIDVIVYDSLLLIDREEPSRLVQGSEDYEYSFNFTTDTGGLDNAYLYMEQNDSTIPFAVTNQTSTISNADCSTSYSEDFTINASDRITDYSVSYSGVQEKTETEDDYIEDSGEVYSANDEERAGSEAWNDWGSVTTDRSDGTYRYYVHSSGEMGIEDTGDDSYVNGQTEAYFQVRMKSEDWSHYNFLGLMIGAGTHYYYLVYDWGDSRWEVWESEDKASDVGYIYPTSIENVLGSWSGNTPNDDEYDTYLFYVDTDDNLLSAWINGNAIIEDYSTTIDSIDSSFYFGIYTDNDSFTSDTTDEIVMDWFKTYYMASSYTDSTATAMGLEHSSNVTLTSDWGVDISIDFTSTSDCRFNASIQLSREMNRYEIFTSSALTTTIVNWTMTGFSAYLSDGDYENNILLELDSGATSWYNFTMEWDTTDPIVSIGGLSDEGMYTVTSLPALRIIADWGSNENDSNSVIIELDYDISSISYQRWEWTDTQDQTAKPEDFPTTARKVTNTVGNHSLRVTLIDIAGNSASSSIWFYVYAEKEIKFSFTSSYDSGSISVKDYLVIFIDGFRYEDSSVSVKYKESFELEVQDKFGNQLYYSASYDYSESISIELDLRSVTLENKINEAIAYKIIQDTSAAELEGSVTPSGTVIIYLQDGDYTVIADSWQDQVGDEYHYEQTAADFTISEDNTTVSITVDLRENANFLITLQDVVTERIEKILIGFIIAVIAAFSYNYYRQNKQLEKYLKRIKKLERNLEVKLKND